MHLLETGPVTAGEIATHLELTTGSVTALIGRLVAAGLVTRSVDVTDRRVVRVERLAGPMAAWARQRLVPKVLVASQTRVIEAVADPAGRLRA